MTEEWRKVTDERFPDYEVSNTGRIRRNGRIRRISVNKFGYCTVHLYNHCFTKCRTIHRLVALAFIPTDDTKLDVNHIDGNKKNNNVENLEWCTRSENHKHAYRTGLKVVTEAQREAARQTGLHTKNLVYMKPKPVACFKDGVLYKQFNRVHDAFHWLGVAISGTISACCSGKKKTYKGFEWRYV